MPRNANHTDAGAFWRSFAKGFAAVLLLFFGGLIINGFPDYFPPRFDRGFLRNREAYFYRSGYAIGFYTHIISSPLVLVIGLLQFSNRLRVRHPLLHQRLGTAYVLLVLLAVTPGGLVLASRTFAGWPAMLGFAFLCGLVWWSTWQAWRLAVAGRFSQHRLWMMRSYLLITSAIALRLVHYGLSYWPLDRVTHYQWSVWLSWVPVLILFELAVRLKGSNHPVVASHVVGFPDTKL